MFSQNAFGATLVLVCAATMAFYLMVVERTTRAITSSAFTTVAMTAAAACFGLQFLAFGDPADLSLNGPAWGLMAGLVVFATVLPLLLMAEGIKRVGAQRGAVVSTVGPPATILLAVAFLGERMEPIQLAGVALIIGGILVLELRGRVQSKGPEI